MKKRLHNKTAIFILFVFALFANELTAQTGTLTASPELVSEFTNGTGTTALTWTSSGAAKVITTLQKTRGNQDLGEGIIINNNQLSHTDWDINYIQDGWTYTFRLYSAEAGSSVLGTLLATAIVVGEAPAVAATGTINASPETVTNFTDGLGNTILTVNTQNSPRMLVSLVTTLPDGTVTNGSSTIIQNNNASGTWDLSWIVEGQIYTFTLHTGETDSSVLGDVLDTVVVYGGATLGIEDTKINDIALDVFPNPVVDVLHIEAASEIQALQIYTITGQKLKEITMDSSKNATIDVSHLEQNIYIVQITTLEGVFSKRFVKK